MATPQSVPEVEQLVKRFYQPGSPSFITQIGDQLQRLQLTQAGWQIADELLGSADPNVRFYAAQTFIVRLNNDGPRLNEEQAQSVLSKLISWLVHNVARGETKLVRQKLCSCLTTYLKRSPLPWKRPLLHLSLSFQLNRFASDDQVERADVAAILPTLLPDQINALLNFSGTLAEEVGRLEISTASYANLHEQMEIDVADARILMAFAFAQSQTDRASIGAEALKCMLTWINYAQPLWPGKPEALKHLRELVIPAAQCLVDPALPNLQDVALEVFRDLLETYTSFFQIQHLQLLNHIITETLAPSFLQALSDHDEKSLSYAKLLIAFGNANVQHLVEQPESQNRSTTLVKLLLDILRSPGIPGDDDQLSILSVEFWNTYVEYVNDLLFSKDAGEPEPEWLDSSRSVLTQVVELLWSKMCPPANDVAKAWDEDQREAFKEFRLDTTDCMLSMSLLLGNSLLKQLVSFALQSLETRQWRRVEAALFCLSTLADNVLEDQPSENVIRNIFISSLFRDVADFTQPIPMQTRRSAIDMLGSYSQYIERHSEFLPDTVRFLFASLEAAPLANIAAKSIASLCSTCRVNLTKYLDDFLIQYEQFLSGPTTDRYTKEKVIGAIAAITQALTPESAKVRPLLALLENVERDIQIAKESAAAGDFETAELVGATALSCLSSIGKGMQVPSDIPILLHDEEENLAARSSFWESRDGLAVQSRIMSCFSLLHFLSHDGDMIEAACHVLKSGFAETEPGPFVLPPKFTASFLQECNINTPQLETVLGTACTLITQHSRNDSKRIDAEVGAIYQHVVTLITKLHQPSKDPGIAQSCIDVCCRMSPYYIHLLVNPPVQLVGEQLQCVLNFTLQAIEGQDILPKRSAAELWSRLIKPSVPPASDHVQARLQEIINVYGPQLSQTLIRQVAGLGQRSELDHICEPLKALITTQRMASSWLEAALFSPAFPPTQQAIGTVEKRRFAQQLIGVRGDSRKTKEIVKKFYADCRGTVVSYRS